MKLEFNNIFEKMKLVYQINDRLSMTFKNSEWDDGVHSSYDPYLKMCSDYCSVSLNYCRYLDQISQEVSCLVSADEIFNRLTNLEYQLRGI